MKHIVVALTVLLAPLVPLATAEQTPKPAVASVAVKPNSFPPERTAVECMPRAGLPNFFAKAAKGGEFKVAYLGGSITAQPGWRVKSLAWLNAQYPKSKFSEINAAIGGTGSDLGVLRIEHDVLNAKPDLLFVEFAVNDGGAAPEEIIKSMEGIVRKTWKTLPACDICFVYTFTTASLPELKTGKFNRSAATMEVVADDYGIPTIHMGLEAVRLESEGKLLMKAPEAKVENVAGDELNVAAKVSVNPDGKIPFSKDGVHPYTHTGHQLYMNAIARSIPAIIKASAEAKPHVLPAPRDPENYENTKMVSLDQVQKKGPWTRRPADTGLGKTFATRINSLWKAEPGAELTFKFKGTAARIYDLLGPDCGYIEVAVDGKTTRLRRIDGYCTYARLALAGIASGLDGSRVHEITIKVLGESLPKEQILFEHNRSDLTKNPKKYSATNWYPGALFLQGELVK